MTTMRLGMAICAAALITFALATTADAQRRGGGVVRGGGVMRGGGFAPRFGGGMRLGPGAFSPGYPYGGGYYIGPPMCNYWDQWGNYLYTAPCQY